MNRVTLLVVPFLSLMSAAAPTHASSTSFDASALSIEGVAIVASGSGEWVLHSGSVIGQGISASAEGAVVMVKGVAEAGESLAELSLSAAAGASLVAGQSIEVVTSSAGALLMVSGQVIAFVPNELAASMIHHEVHR
jgi:hypothetical protein